MDEIRQLRDKNKELEAENAHLQQQLREMTQKLLESQAGHERMAKILDATRNAPAPAPAVAPTSSQDRNKETAPKRRGLHLF